MTCLVRRLRSPQRRNEGGFALLLTIALMMFFSVSVVALLGMTLTGAGLSTLQAKTAREQSASESALDTSINKIRTDVAAGSYDPLGTNVCNGAMPSNLSIDGVQPSVTCRAKETDGVHVPEESNRSLKVIGTGTYDGLLAASITEDGSEPLKVVGHAKVQGTMNGPIQIGGTYSQATGDCGAIQPLPQAQVTCPGDSLSDSDQLPDESDPSTLWSASEIAGQFTTRSDQLQRRGCRQPERRCISQRSDSAAQFLDRVVCGDLPVRSR